MCIRDRDGDPVAGKAFPATGSPSCEKIDKLKIKNRAKKVERNVVVFWKVSWLNLNTENPLLLFFESIQNSPVKNQAQK